MINISTKTINPTARYRVTMTDPIDGSAEERIMIGADLKQTAYAIGHLYDINAELIPDTKQDTQIPDTAETEQDAETAPAAETETETAETIETTETAPDAERDARIIELMQKSIDCISPRSAWGRGVKLYACELLGSLAECVEWARKNGEPSPLESRETVRAALLNGAEDWSQYSWGGCSLIYSGDIAERLCSHSELKRKRGGELPPNAAEDWLDVQARALRRAAQYVIGTYDLAANGQYLIREGART